MSFINSREVNLDLRKQTIPRGAIIVYWGTVAPAGFLLCNGATYSSVDYQKLANALSITATSFTVPNIAAPVAGTAYILKT